MRRGCWWYRDRCRRCETWRMIRGRAKARPLRKLLLDVGDEIPDVGAAIEQAVQAAYDFLARGCVRVGVDSRVPFAGGSLKLSVHVAKFLLKIFLLRFETLFKSGEIAARGFGFAKCVE